jgi:ankyrin repeat protein
MKTLIAISRSAGIVAAGIIFGWTSFSSAADESSNKQFFDAIKNGDIAEVKELLKRDSSLAKASDEKGRTAILYAVYAKHKEIAELLIASGVEPNIFEAAATGRIKRVRGLLKQQPELSQAYSPDGWTALHLNFNNLEMAKLLIDSGADLNLNSKNKLNATPLQGAAANNWIDLAKLYLSRGANVNCRSEEGGSPLHEAAANGFLEFARLLIDSGADVNQRDDNGKTALTNALQYKKPELAKLLREHGATE